MFPKRPSHFKNNVNEKTESYLTTTFLSQWESTEHEIEFRYDYFITNASNNIYYRILLQTLRNSPDEYKVLQKTKFCRKFVQRLNLSFSKREYAINFVMIICLKQL